MAVFHQYWDWNRSRVVAATALVVLATASPSQAALLPAFPGAEGHGASSVGGRGGRIVEVTNLNDSGPGSLRDAMEASGPRIVVFRVAGTIQLLDIIRVKDPYVTVAGQTAPGGGILLRGTDNTLIRVDGGTHDVILRYLRLRNGSGLPDGFGNDNLNVRWASNVIADHISMSWSTDENASIYIQTGSVGEAVSNVTLQRSILGQGIQGHAKGLEIGGKADFTDPANPIEYWRRIERVSIHHNLMTDNEDRNPRVNSAGTEVANNVSYNWNFWIGETTRGSIVDHVNNYFKAGPMSANAQSKGRFLIHDLSDDAVKREPSIYTVGNVVIPDRPDPGVDNWGLYKMISTYQPLPLSFRRLTPLAAAPIPVRIESAAAAYEAVLADVGANARLDCQGNWIPNADSVDQRILSEVRNNTGPIVAYPSPEAAGGYPVLDPGTPCPDADHDGMPDAWESRYGFNANDPADGSRDADLDGYTNVEEYLNGTIPSAGQPLPPPPAPAHLRRTDITALP